MGLYTIPSLDAPSDDRNMLWNPCDVLGIINPDPGYQCITCVGFAPSKRRRCRNPIRAENRSFIMRTLNEIAYLQPDNPTVVLRLRAIVGSALCVRYHQDQEETVLQQWKYRVQDVIPQTKGRLCTKPTQSSREKYTSRAQPFEDTQEQIQEMKILIAELRKELERQRQKDRGSEDHSRNQQESESRQRQEDDRKRQEQERREREERGREAKRQEEERREKERQKEEERRKKELEERELRERQRQEKEQREREQKAREQAERNEELRQKAHKLREEKERKERERLQKERDEWDRAWKKYQERWTTFKGETLFYRLFPHPSDILNPAMDSASRAGSIREAIPWPVKSGSYSDVKDSAVEEFLQKAPPRTAIPADVVKLMRSECLKWHPDKIPVLFRGFEVREADRQAIDMICRVVTGMLNKADGRL